MMVNVSCSVFSLLKCEMCPENCTSFDYVSEKGVFLTSNHFSYKESYHFSTVENQKA